MRRETADSTAVGSAGFCPHCGRKLTPREHVLNGVKFSAGFFACKCPGSIAEMREKEEAERRKIEHENEMRFERAVEKSGIPPIFRKATADTESYLEWIRGGGSIVFSGGVGTGKTYLSCAIGLAALKEMTVHFTSIGKIKRAILSHEAPDEKLYRQMAGYDLLILDDLGKEKPSDWLLELTFGVIDQRYERGKPVVITTNYTSAKLADRLSAGGDRTTADAICSRLYEMCAGNPIELAGGDRRLELPGR